MSQPHQRILAVVVAVSMLVLSGLIIAPPETFGLSRVAVAWIGLAMIGLSALQGFLPAVQKRADGAADRAPLPLAGRLSPEALSQVASELERRMRETPAHREAGDNMTGRLVTQPPHWLPKVESGSVEASTASWTHSRDAG